MVVTYRFHCSHYFGLRFHITVSSWNESYLQPVVIPLCRRNIIIKNTRPGGWGGVFQNRHYSDVIMSAIACQITSVSIVYSTISSDANQSKHQSFASLAFVRGINQWAHNIFETYLHAPHPHPTHPISHPPPTASPIPSPLPQPLLKCSLQNSGIMSQTQCVKHAM